MVSRWSWGVHSRLGCTKRGDVIKSVGADFEPAPGEDADRFEVSCDTVERPVIVAGNLLVLKREKVETHRGKVVGIQFERTVVHDVSLAVEPTDWPVIPAAGAPIETSGVGEGVLLEARRFVMEVGGVAKDAEGNEIAQGQAHRDAPAVIELFPGCAGAAVSRV